jgi:uncharacterized protein YndB with AHSA1/START domain
MRTDYEPAGQKGLPAFECKRLMKASAATLYRAWTEGFGTWFAIPDSVIMRPEVDSAFFFETQYQGQRHPHYGRFLELEVDRLVALTWLNAALDGAETVVTVRLEPRGSGTLLHLSHTDFPNEQFRDETGQAWPAVLEQQDRAVKGREFG